MKHVIIPIFVTYKGCPKRCIFCNERITAGDYPDRISEDLFHQAVHPYLEEPRKTVDTIQIAFYGGNFTGIERGYQEELLELAESYVARGMVNSIRISTRPDYIDRERIEFLKQYSVKTVEIGAQSMNDEVLHLSKRGHTRAQIKNAVGLLKRNGFETGIHLMAGLPGDTRDSFYHTVEETIKLRPHMVRLHPTIVFKDTPLAKAYLNGEYRPLSMDEAIELCKYALIRFGEEDIPLIRLGLQHTFHMETRENIVAGPYHPAFRSLVEGSIFLEMARQLLTKTEKDGGKAVFFISPKDVSNFRGMRNRNIQILNEEFGTWRIGIEEDPEQERESLILVENEKRHESSFTKMNYDKG